MFIHDPRLGEYIRLIEGVRKLTMFLDRVLDLLVEKGVLTPEELKKAQIRVLSDWDQEQSHCGENTVADFKSKLEE